MTFVVLAHGALRGRSPYSITRSIRVNTPQLPSMSFKAGFLDLLFAKIHFFGLKVDFHRNGRSTSTFSG